VLSLASDKVAVTATWKASRLTGSVKLQGTASESVTLTVALAKRARTSASVGRPRTTTTSAKPCRLALAKVCTLTLAAGSFTSTLPLADRLLPGSYELRIRGVADGLAVVPLVIPAPAEGVVDKVRVSTTPRGADLATVPDGARQFIVTFRFAALPKRPLLTLVVRYPDGTEVAARDRYKAARFVPVRQPKPPGRDHETGTWRFTLKSGDRVISAARVQVVS
jgi:hypothetical protein